MIKLEKLQRKTLWTVGFETESALGLLNALYIGDHTGTTNIREPYRPRNQTKCLFFLLSIQVTTEF